MNAMALILLLIVVLCVFFRWQMSYSTGNWLVLLCYLENTTEVDFTYILLGVLQNFRYSYPYSGIPWGVEIPCIVVHTVELPLTFLLVQIRVEIKNTAGGYENSEVIVKGI